MSGDKVATPLQPGHPITAMPYTIPPECYTLEMLTLSESALTLLDKAETRFGAVRASDRVTREDMDGLREAFCALRKAILGAERETLWHQGAQSTSGRSNASSATPGVSILSAEASIEGAMKGAENAELVDMDKGTMAMRDKDYEYERTRTESKLFADLREALTGYRSSLYKLQLPANSPLTRIEGSIHPAAYTHLADAWYLSALTTRSLVPYLSTMIQWRLECAV